ncbi:MAG: DUF5723 family protein [Candidatus Cryptobacteroides sp.]
MKRFFTTIFAALAITAAAGAQALTGSYFLDNSLMRNRLNPAFTPRANYFGIPAISNLGVGVYGNFGVSDLLYPKDGQLYTFLNSNVTSEEFAKKIAKYPGIDLDFNTDILNFGFYTSEKAFWSVDVGIKANASVGIPRDFLLFLKNGMDVTGQQTVYSMKGFNMFADASAYVSVGHSRDLSNIVKGLKVGAKFKFYVSMASIGMDLGNSTLSLSNDKWTVNADATGQIASSFFRVEPSAAEGEMASFKTDFSKLKPAGYGFSFDLGAEYRLSIGCPVDGMTFSLSLLDLGGIFYNGANVQNLKSQGSASFEGMGEISLDENMNFNEALEGIKDDFLAIADFEEIAGSGFSVATGPQLYAGVEMPFLHDIMSVGLLYNAKFGRRSTINELTLSYNLTPCKWFNFGLNWSFLNSWKTLGWVIEFSPKSGVDFFIGSDYTFFQVMPQYFLPVDKAWVNARFGLNFMIGSKHRK